MNTPPGVYKMSLQDILLKHVIPTGENAYCLPENFVSPDNFLITNVALIDEKNIDFKVTAKFPGVYDYGPIDYTESFRLTIDYEKPLGKLQLSYKMFVYNFHTDEIDETDLKYKPKEYRLNLLVEYMIPGIALSLYEYEDICGVHYDINELIIKNVCK